jgi:uncharacterized protein (TIGR00251 family)
MTVDVRVIPRAKKTEFAGTRDGALLIRVSAPPVDGAANDAVIEFLARHLNIPQRRIRLVSGATSRQKRFEIDGVTPEQIRDLQ